MSYYVSRQHLDERPKWVGPIRSLAQAERELRAWESCGFEACVVESTPEVRKIVRKWQHEANVRLGRVRA